MPIINHNVFVVLLAGISFLILGLSMASEALQKLAANQIQRVLSRLKNNDLLGILVGTTLTVLMQSSGAVTATLVNLGTARVISLSQVMAVLIGAAIGGTLTIHLLSLHVAEFSLPLFIFGFVVQFLSRQWRVKRVFQFMMGIGLLFFGMELIGASSQSLRSAPIAANLLSYLSDRPIATFFVSAIVTGIFQSSTAVIGMVIGFTVGGALSLSDAVLWVYGANIGATATAIIASLKGDYVGQRIAWANLLFRLATVLVFFPTTEFLVDFLGSWDVGPATRIAVFFTSMNVIGAIVFFPLRGFGMAVIERLVQPGEKEKEFGVRFLRRSNYESLPLGLAHAKREILEMGDIVHQMAEASLQMYRQFDPDLYHKIKACDDRVDLLLKEIKFFLIRVSQRSPEGLNRTVIDLISFVSDLESAADTIDLHISDLAGKKHRLKIEFTDDEWRDISEMHACLMKAMELSLTTFQTEDQTVASELIQVKRTARDLEKRFREAHIERLSREVVESFGASTIYLESLSTFVQLIELLAKSASRVHGAASQHNVTPSERSG